MSIEAMKLARSVISSINQGKQNALTVNDETVFWQREEWVRWALDEVLPVIDQAIEQAQKQEPVAVCWRGVQSGELFGPEILTPDFDDDSTNLVWLYTSPPQRQPLTDEQISDLVQSTTGITMPFYKAFVRAIEAAHGIKGEA